ncbi:DEAD/DEAH box helicase [Bacillus carboniphilus]|uniref:DEAD-box ATP-dependent RNA helicase CshB n=1 Tax=Bacillus carboniphilus TaxID=86663 RepID=A0ABY9JZH4_9BACI|nr:DEAD/DEAH box helicase [Bacillus carboniphilus]WLR43967.1 DEAD/DEAH box helicase [Bacillus carboniphilus]
MEKTAFAQFDFKPFILEAISELSFSQPTEVQERMIPSILRGKSSIGQSQTGTGKTHAYLLPLINNINPSDQEVQVVITAPTRELANQIYKEVINITSKCPEGQLIQANSFIGGTDKKRSIEKLKKQPHIVVGTPGRILDIVKEQALDIHKAKTIVIDEADLMLDLGFIYEVDQLASRMVKDLQILVFSATIPEKLKPFLKKYMENPSFTQVDPTQLIANNVENILVPIRHRNEISLVYDMLQTFQPYLAMIFTNTKKRADEVANSLRDKGLEVALLHGGLQPRERKKVMKQVKELQFQYIVATDLAARGIDIPGVSHIINIEIPMDLDFLIHRIGRTARAGNSGVAFTLFSEEDEEKISKLEKLNVHFQNKDLINGEWVSIEDRNRRKNRKKQTQETDKIANRYVQKPKKVKPGYKKKMKEEMDKVKRRERRKKKR